MTDTLISAFFFLIGVVIASLIAWWEYRHQALNKSGAYAAAVVGSVMLGLGGWALGSLLLAFFFSSVLLSKLTNRRKHAAAQQFEKGSNRDAWQVLANGGLPALIVLIERLVFWFGKGGISHFLLSLLVSGGLAAATADTWATEIGSLWGDRPRLITTFKRVEPGSSGGVTLVGILAALAGSAFIAWFNWVLLGHRLYHFVIAAPAFGGLAGSLVDSILGATLQAQYECPNCQKLTEKHPIHTCGMPTRLYKGVSWLNNDWVNFFCVLTGTLFTWLIYTLL